MRCQTLGLELKFLSSFKNVRALLINRDFFGQSAFQCDAGLSKLKNQHFSLLRHSPALIAFVKLILYFLILAF
jgi:hypothetical protein